jgi:hypothetical protein
MQANKMTLKASQEAGKISLGNTKMPSTTFAISAKHCGVGGKLVNIKGSTCNRCYALKLQKLRPSVDQGWTTNLLKAVAMIETNPALWAKQVAFQIVFQSKKIGVNHHRWFDSGDLQSVAMLHAICLAAELTPDHDHWLPTREAKIVKDYRKQYGVEPSNLCIRVSATMIDDKPMRGHANTSTVHSSGAEVHGKECNAYRTNTDARVLSVDEYKAFKKLKPQAKKDSGIDLGHCGDCRACWSKSVPNISYPLH